DYSGSIILDVLVQPTEEVIDYLTEGTGFLPSHFLHDDPIFLDDVLEFQDVRQRVQDTIHGQNLVGYELWIHLQSLQLRHPANKTRDVATYLPLLEGLIPGEDNFKEMVRQFLGRDIHERIETATEDSFAAMALFKLCETDWEASITNNVWPCILPPPEYLQWYT
ncbi:uncharacterized protein EI90DRAFT_2918400, partial [Cantharellus anzutake]|uniref:uncharacterized protein n=1 Tax=Cantharellus anzutake TaxID=1750568 RepID=UPI00190331E4